TAPSTPAEESGPRPDPPTPDPRVTFPTEFRNVRPEVGYVGDDACAGCHARIVQSYRGHPMGRSAEWVGRPATATDHVAGGNNPCTAGVYTLSVERKGDRVWHRVTVNGPDGKPLSAYEVRADLVIGSGTQGRSYLTVEH